MAEALLQVLSTNTNPLYLFWSGIVVGHPIFDGMQHINHNGNIVALNHYIVLLVRISIVVDHVASATPNSTNLPIPMSQVRTGKWRFITTRQFHLDNVAFYTVKSIVFFFIS